MVTLSLIIWLLSIIGLIILPRFLFINRSFSLIVIYAIIGQTLGVIFRSIMIINEWDKAIGPSGDYVPHPSLVSAFYLYISLFNLCLVLGACFVALPIQVLRKNKEKSNREEEVIPRKGISSNRMKYTLFLISLPGLILILKSILFGSNLLNSTDVEANRINVSGEGLSILVMEIPVTCMILWYSFKKGKITPRWIISMIALVFLFLLTGNRSKMVMVVLLLVGVLIQCQGYKSIIKKIPQVSMLGVIVLYLGWSIIHIRGALLKYGGTFGYWLKDALLTNPIDIIVAIYRSSFNGYDGFLSILSNVPDRFHYRWGQFWYESFTGIIPRTFWQGKWEVPMTNDFTRDVWGWDQGGMFVTGPGVLYLDGGFWGIFFGGIITGALIVIFIEICKKLFINEDWMYRFLVSSVAFFLCRFMFAGGSNDVIFLHRLIIQSIIIISIINLKISLNKYEKGNVKLSMKK